MMVGSGAFWICKDSLPSEEAVLLAKDEEGHRGLRSQLLCVCFSETVAWQAPRTVAASGQSHKPLEGNLYGLYCGAARKRWEYCDLDYYWIVFKISPFYGMPRIPSTQSLAKLFMQQVYWLHAVPKCIISDQGLQFMSKFWWQFLSLIGSCQDLAQSIIHKHMELVSAWTQSWNNTCDVMWIINKQLDWASAICWSGL